MVQRAKSMLPPPWRPPHGRPTRPVQSVRVNPVIPDVSLIMPARNEVDTLEANILRLAAWQRVLEIIVIANGCSDDTASVARRAGARVIEYEMALGEDTGRALGAQVARGHFLVFLDADIIWQLEDVTPFVHALQAGADIALNAYPHPDSTYSRHRTAIAKRALNLALERPELYAASLTAVPHAMRRSVLDVIGVESLAVPPLAHARAALAGLAMVAPHHVNVHLRNRWTRDRSSRGYSVTDLIIGDHVEAFAHLLGQRGERAGFPDTIRNRACLTTYHDPDVRPDAGVVAVVPAKNEASTLRDVIEQVRQTSVRDVFIVENGSTDNTLDVARRCAAHVRHFARALGHDVGRAVGTMALNRPTSVLYLDSDFAIPAGDLSPFLDAVTSRGVDVALNDLTTALPDDQDLDAVSTMKEFLNIALGRPDLGISSMTAVPHALSARAVATIPPLDLAVPPRALVRSVLQGLHVRPVHCVDVIRPNRYRPLLHSKQYGERMSRLIIGDHLEALALLIAERGQRAGFIQPRCLNILVASPPQTQR